MSISTSLRRRYHMDMPERLDRVRRLASASPGLRLLVLYGSRARGTAHARSDWDLGFLADAGFDVDGLLAGLAEDLGADHVDLADLSRASVVLRHAVAGDGVVLHERAPGEFHAFQLGAVTDWSDMEMVIRTESDALLARLHS